MDYNKIAWQARRQILQIYISSAVILTSGAAAVVAATNRRDVRTLIVVFTMLHEGATSRHLRDATLEKNMPRLLRQRVCLSWAHFRTATACLQSSL